MEKKLSNARSFVYAEYSVPSISHCKAHNRTVMHMNIHRAIGIMPINLVIDNTYIPHRFVT